MKSRGPILTVVLLALGAASAERAGLDKLFKQPHMVLPKDFPVEMTVLPGKRAFNMLGKKPLEIPPYQVTEFRQGPVTFPQLTMVTAGSAKVAIRQTESQSRQGYSFKLEENGHIYALHSLSPALLRLTRSKMLRRIKEKKGWVYVK